MNSTSRDINIKIYSRAVVAIIMITAWILVGISGFILWIAPPGPRSGSIPLLFDLTKNDWREVYIWIAVITAAMTLIHIIIDWKTLLAVLKYMVSIHRDRVIWFK